MTVASGLPMPLQWPELSLQAPWSQAGVTVDPHNLETILNLLLMFKKKTKTLSHEHFWENEVRPSVLSFVAAYGREQKRGW